MCLAVPSEIIHISGSIAKVSFSGNVREIDVSLVEAPAVGEWVLVHAGFAIDKISATDAEETIRLLMAIAEENPHAS